MRIDTLAVHAGKTIDAETGAVVAPIHLSTTFERDPEGGYSRGHMYTRHSNPNRNALESSVATLEGGAAAVAFSSGCAALAALFRTLAPGDAVIAPREAYHGTLHLLRGELDRWGLCTSFVDMTDPSQVKRALGPKTKIILVESPSNPMLKISDIEAIAEIARSAKAICVCDNTWTSAVIQRPLELGAHLVMYSSTKYLGGHCDVLGGMIVAKESGGVLERLRTIQGSEGAVPSPFDCWLLLRSISSLPQRMRAHAANAERVAAYLEEHPSVSTVHYPGLASHPQHQLAQKQMKSFGGMLSFEVKGGESQAMAVAASVRLFTRATSLGGVESLIEHRASVEGKDTLTPKNLLRLSIGLEDPEDLMEDLGQALGG